MLQRSGNIILTVLLTSFALLAVVVQSTVLYHSVEAAVPTEVQLGGAIVAAVEQDVEEEDNVLNMQRERAQNEANLATLEQIFNLLDPLDEGRGKFNKQRKILKYLYPLLLGVLMAKTVLIPLVLKLLTALASTSFVMSKIALATSALLAIKWLFVGDGGRQGTHVEVLHVPVVKTLQHSGSATWEDLSLHPSHLVETKLKQPRQNYIPVAGSGGGRDSVASGNVQEFQPFL